MDKLQWFKFSYADWRMGKIQRCPEITQARFLNLCCVYWSKECILSYEDAEIEIDEEHIDLLIKKKIVTITDDFINISFLDEQFAEIEEKSKDRRISGIIGNLKRWHPIIYKRYENKEINLDDAIKLSQSVADLSHTDSSPIAEQSQSIADKSREEEIREEEIIKENKQTKVFNFRKSLLDLGADEKLVIDWLKVRNKKKASNTETALNSFMKQVVISKRSYNEVLEECVVNSWAGFKSDWIKAKPKTNEIPEGYYRNSFTGQLVKR